jgi:hypothetical protein
MECFSSNINPTETTRILTPSTSNTTILGMKSVVTPESGLWSSIDCFASLKWLNYPFLVEALAKGAMLSQSFELFIRTTA